MGKGARVAVVLFLIGLGLQGTAWPEVEPMPVAAPPGAAQGETGKNGAPAAVPSKRIGLTADQSILIDTPSKIKRVSVTKPEVADVVVVSPSQMLIHGKGPGMTTLIYWNEEEVPTSFDLVVEPYVERIREALRAIAPDEEVEIGLSDGSLFLTGTVSSEAVRTRLGEGAKVYAKTVVNLLKAAQLEQILLQVRVAEVDRNLAKELGFTSVLQPVIDGGVYRIGVNSGNSFTTLTETFRDPPTLGPDAPFGDLSNVFLVTPGQIPKFAGFLRVLHDRGALKVLAEPNMVVASGGEGKFLVGGEFPIVYTTAAGGTTSFSITYKEFGVRLHFLPRIADNGEIYMKVAQEVSDLDFANAVILSGFRIPALRSRKAESGLQLADGQTFVMAGLIDNEISRQVTKIPFLGDIPILGALFRNVRYRNNETELMVIVTPKIVRPLSQEEIPALPTDTIAPEETTSELLP